MGIIDIKRIIEFNDRLRTTLKECGSLPASMQLKLHDGIMDYAKPLLHSDMVGLPKDVWGVVICCEKCKKEQSILFEYISDDADAMKNFVKKIILQMEYFKKKYCSC